MHSLILEASTEHALLAVSGGTCLHLPGGPTLSKSLGAEIKQFLTYAPFERIIVGTGPGSFTGIRVAASMAQALAFGWKIPLFVASSLSAFAPQTEERFAVIIDARSGGLYVQIGFETPKRLTLAEASEALADIQLLASPHPAKILTRIPHLSAKTWQETRPNPALLEQHASPAPVPLCLDYLSHLS